MAAGGEMADLLDISFEKSEIKNKGNNGKNKAVFDSPECSARSRQRNNRTAQRSGLRNDFRQRNV